MCGCGNAVQSGPVGAELKWVARPNDPKAPERSFSDRTAADSYVAAFGGGSVQQEQKQLEAA